MVNQKFKKLINFNGFARKFLKCKSNPHKNSVNYEYFGYQKNIVEDVSFEKPTSSTMISTNYDHLVNSTELSSCKQSKCCSHDCHSFNDNEMEQSRKETSFISTIQKDGTLLFQPINQTVNDEYEDITLINNNNSSSKTTSPLSQYKSFNYGYQNTSNNSNNYEYLHSTKINNQDSSELVHLLQPNNSESFNLSTNSSSSSSGSSSNTTNLSLISSPISTSTSFSSKTEPNNRKLNLNSIDSTKKIIIMKLN